jgi:hypothetical protein
MFTLCISLPHFHISRHDLGVFCKNLMAAFCEVAPKMKMREGYAQGKIFEDIKD